MNRIHPEREATEGGRGEGDLIRRDTDEKGGEAIGDVLEVGETGAQAITNGTLFRIFGDHELDDRLGLVIKRPRFHGNPKIPPR